MSECALVVNPDWIQEHCLSNTGKMNNWTTHESWWINRNFDKQLEAIKSTGYSIQEALWLIYYGLKKPPKCKTCGGDVNFTKFKSGYREYCSIRCVTQSKERNAKISKATVINAPDRLKKVRATNLERYGDSVYYKTDDFKDKAACTKLQKYGNPAYCNDDKRHQTCLIKYGVEDPLTLHDVQVRMQKAKLKKYNGEFFPGKSPHSKAEDEVRAYVESITGKQFPPAFGVLSHGLELDGYNDELKVAFEYCGLFWHSEDKKYRIYHRDKLEQCRKLGFRLFTIFEDEWLNRNHQVKNFISSALGVYETRIPARKCTVHIFTRNDKNQVMTAQTLLDDEHIQGSSGRSHTWVALEYNGEMIGVMSFSKHHRQGNGDKLILNRMCFRSGLQVIGGASKMFSHALFYFDNTCDILSWSDNRWTEGNVYKKLGFELDGEMFVDYSYVGNKQNRIPKQSMQKKKTGCPPDVTERDWCLQEYGLHRIWDCGKKRWVYHRK